jgi:DNA-binding NtrC family response regulator
VTKSILVATKNQRAGEAIRHYSGPEYKVEVVSSKESCLTRFKQKRREFTFLDIEILREPEAGKTLKDDAAALRPFKNNFPAAILIVLSSKEKIPEAIRMVKAGADGYLTYPIHEDELKFFIDRLYQSIRRQSELDHLRVSSLEKEALGILQTKSPAMQEVLNKIHSVAPTKSTVLLTGETGTGKTLLASVIHGQSNRKNAQFISVHCGSIPDTLMESELFGHEKGAFTGADRRKLGKFEIAHGGTIFLDEIGTVTSAAQIKLLRVLQERILQRLGGDVDIEVDVRIVAATNTDLRKLCDQGLFRRDLYYRLSVFPIEILSLRERVEDIPVLTDFFLKKMNILYSKEIRGLHPKVLEVFKNYPWPGNIRELENLIERAYILETSSLLTPASFPGELFTAQQTRKAGSLDASLPLAEVRRRGVEALEQDYLQEVLALHRGHIQKTAEAAGITTRQLSKLLKKHGLKKESFKKPISPS